MQHQQDDAMSRLCCGLDTGPLQNINLFGGNVSPHSSNWSVKESKLATWLF